VRAALSHAPLYGKPDVQFARPVNCRVKLPCPQHLGIIVEFI